MLLWLEFVFYYYFQHLNTSKCNSLPSAKYLFTSSACYFFINKVFPAVQWNMGVTLQMSEALNLDQLEEVITRLIIKWKYDSGTFQAAK